MIASLSIITIENRVAKYLGSKWFEEVSSVTEANPTVDHEDLAHFDYSIRGKQRSNCTQTFPCPARNNLNFRPLQPHLAITPAAYTHKDYKLVPQASKLFSNHSALNGPKSLRLFEVSTVFVVSKTLLPLFSSTILSKNWSNRRPGSSSGESFFSA